MRNPQDRDGDRLVRLAKRGDRDALGTLFARHSSRLERVAGARLPRRLRRKVSVRDLVQDAQLIAMRKIVKFRGGREEALGVWLERILELRVREAVRRFVRTGKRSVGREVGGPDSSGVGRLHARTPTPSQLAIAGELAHAADRALAQLPDHYSLVLRLARHERLPLTDIARRMGRSHEAVKKLFARALRQYREILRRRGVL